MNDTAKIPSSFIINLLDKYKKLLMVLATIVFFEIGFIGYQYWLNNNRNQNINIKTQQLDNKLIKQEKNLLEIKKKLINYVSSKKTTSQNQPTPNNISRHHVLENYSITNLSVIGTVNRSGKVIALIKAPNLKVIEVGVGNVIGKEHGIVIAIKKMAILIKLKGEDKINKTISLR